MLNEWSSGSLNIVSATMMSECSLGGSAAALRWQMACRREIKHMADQARVSVFSLDAEDKLLMIPGQNVVVDMQKHELGLTPLL